MTANYVYFAVRRTEDREWFDPQSLAYDHSAAIRHAHETDKSIPSWAKYNPVVRSARVLISETEDVCACS